MLLSILIPSIQRHHKQFCKLLYVLNGQMHQDVEVLYDLDETASTGAKRNNLLKQAKGKYVVFIDADDEIPAYYIAELLNAITSDADCLAINGTITTNGKNPKKWFISKDLPYMDSTDEKGNKIYLRYPNHICPMKREIAVQVTFPDKTIGEDYEWATELHKQGLIKTEHVITPPMYFYQYQSKNTK